MQLDGITVRNRQGAECKSDRGARTEYNETLINQAPKLQSTINTSPSQASSSNRPPSKASTSDTPGSTVMSYPDEVNIVTLSTLLVSPTSQPKPTRRTTPKSQSTVDTSPSQTSSNRPSSKASTSDTPGSTVMASPDVANILTSSSAPLVSSSQPEPTRMTSKLPSQLKLTHENIYDDLLSHFFHRGCRLLGTSTVEMDLTK